MAKVTQKGAAKARIPTLISLTPKPKFFLPVTQASGFPGPPGPSNTISSANGVTGRAPSVTDTAAKSSCYTGIIAQMGMCGHLCISDTTLPTPTTLFFKIPSNPKLLTTHEPQKKRPATTRTKKNHHHACLPIVFFRGHALLLSAVLLSMPGFPITKSKAAARTRARSTVPARPQQQHTTLSVAISLRLTAHALWLI